MASRLNDNLHVAGHVSCETMDIPNSTVVDADVSASAAIAATKLVNRFRVGFNQAHGSAGTTERRTIYRARANATINFVSAYMSVAPSGAATHTIKLKKNNSDILSSDLVIDNANTAYTGDEDAAGFTSASLVAGDVLELVVTAAAGGGTLGQGLCIDVEIDESPA